MHDEQDFERPHKAHRHIGASAGALLALLLPAHTSLAANSITTIGVGNSSCATWPQNAQANGVGPMQQWVLGYLSGLAVAFASHDLHRDVLAHLDGPSLLVWISRYCDQHPSATIVDATVALATTISETH